jgi:hypothetical protein
VQGGHLTAGFAAEHDTGGARPGPGMSMRKAQGSSPSGWRRSPLRTAGTGISPRMISWPRRTTISPGPSILGWGSVSTPGPSEYQPHSSPQTCGCSGTSVRTVSSGRPRRLRRTALATGAVALSGLNGPVLANATTPVPASGRAPWRSGSRARSRRGRRSGARRPGRGRTPGPARYPGIGLVMGLEHGGERPGFEHRAVLVGAAA